jgi:RHS repeat-associated protein
LLTSVVIGNISETFTYNDKGELAMHVATYSGSPVYSGTFHSTAAPRDNLGRITQKIETVAGVTRTDDYQYDTRGRLLNVARNGDLVSVYDHDDNGNRLSLTNPSTSSVTLGSYDDQDRVVAYGSFEYTFNENGDLTSKFNTATNEETTYEYDARGALLSVVLPDSTFIEYVIDGQGRRIGKKLDGVSSQAFLYRDPLRIAAELDGTGNVVAQFVYVKPNYSPDFMIKGGQVYRFLKDQLGSPRVVINALTGAAAQILEYDEFGNVLTDSAPGFQPFGFAGGLYDGETGLVRFGARDYDPQIGRWASKDPILWKGQQTNLYVYVGANPVTNTDPSGLTTYGCYRKLFTDPHGDDRDPAPILNHQYICVQQGNHIICGGMGPTGSRFDPSGSPGRPTDDDFFGPNKCDELRGDDPCLESCLASKIESNERPYYNSLTYNCQDYAQDILDECNAWCQ